MNPWKIISYAIERPAVEADDTFIAHDGTYTENVDVSLSKDNLAIQSENGSSTCIVTANVTSDHVFQVTANDVNIYLWIDGDWNNS